MASSNDSLRVRGEGEETLCVKFLHAAVSGHGKPAELTFIPYGLF